MSQARLGASAGLVGALTFAAEASARRTPKMVFGSDT
jgi:hypothetical protein